MNKYYLCGIAFQHELGETDDVAIFTSLRELKFKHDCWAECGIVKIQSEDNPEDYISHEWIVKQNLNRELDRE